MQTRQEEKLSNSNRHYSLRKLSVGLASVLIGISFLNGTKTTVKADTIANNNDEYAKAHENNESNESMQATLLKNTDVAEGDSVHTQRDKNVDTAGILAGTSSVQSSSAAQNSNISTKAGEVSKAGNFEVAGDISSAQNSVAKPQRNNLLDDLDKQKTFTENNQAEAKNQENRKEDLGQNLTTPDETKSTLTTKSDAEKSITQTSSDQHVNNQLNNRVEGNSQAQPQNSLKLAKRMLTTNLITTPPMTNGGFDEATWGKLDVNNWQGSVQDGIYQLSGYTGDVKHIIVPNEADFEQAGKSTNGLQVGINGDTALSLFSKQAQTIAFSKTNNEKVKAIGMNWAYAFTYHRILSKFDGSNLDVSGVTDMHGMFQDDSISDLTSLAHWDVSNVTDMTYMFRHNSISDLTPLKNWDTGKVISMSGMFVGNSDVIDLKPIANWNVSSVKSSFNLFAGDSKLNLININNTPLMQGFLKMPYALQGSTFITNNVDLVKAVVGKDASKLPISTNTATRTITFYIPHAAPEQTIQHIYYKTIAPVQIDYSIHYTLGGGGFSSGTGSSVVVGGHGSSSGGAGGAAGGASGSGSFSGDGSSSGTGNGVIIRNRMRMAFARVGAPVQTGSDGPKIIKTYSAEDVKESDWQLDDSKPNDNVIIDGVICFKPVQIPHINGYKPYIIKDPVNPAMFLVSFFAVPERLQNNQSNNVQLPQKPVQSEQTQPEQTQPEQKQTEQKQPEQKQTEQKQPEQKQTEQKQPEQKQIEQKQIEQKQTEQKQSEQKQSEQKQSEQKQPEQKPVQPIQTRPADDKQVDQAINHSSYTLMHNDSTFDNVNGFEPVQNDSAQFENTSDSTQKDDATKIVNAVKPKKHIAKKHVVKRHKKYAKKYHLKRRLRKHTKRSRHAKKRLIKHRKRASRKFRKYNLKHIKKA